MRTAIFLGLILSQGGLPSDKATSAAIITVVMIMMDVTDFVKSVIRGH